MLAEEWTGKGRLGSASPQHGEAIRRQETPPFGLAMTIREMAGVLSGSRYGP